MLVALKSKSFPATFAALGLAVLAMLSALIWEIHLISIPMGVIARIEQNEVDELLTLLVLVGVAFAFDHRRSVRRHQEILKNERLRVLQMTMRTVLDIVNNCLNELQLLRLDAEGHVPEDSLVTFDKAIDKASARLKALGDLETLTEKRLAVGSGIDDGWDALQANTLAASSTTRT